MAAMENPKEKNKAPAAEENKDSNKAKDIFHLFHSQVRDNKSSLDELVTFGTKLFGVTSEVLKAFVSGLFVPELSRDPKKDDILKTAADSFILSMRWCRNAKLKTKEDIAERMKQEADGRESCLVSGEEYKLFLSENEVELDNDGFVIWIGKVKVGHARGARIDCKASRYDVYVDYLYQFKDLNDGSGDYRLYYNAENYTRALWDMHYE